MHLLVELTQVLLLQVLEEVCSFCAAKTFYPIPCRVAVKVPVHRQQTVIQNPWPAHSPPCPNRMAAMENAISYLVKALPVKHGPTSMQGLGTWWSIPGCLTLCGGNQMPCTAVLVASASSWHPPPPALGGQGVQHECSRILS